MSCSPSITDMKLPVVDAESARAVLCRLLASIHCAIAEAEANAASARTQAGVRQGERAPRDEVALIASIDEALAIKTTALEEEACRVDALLERLDDLRMHEGSNQSTLENVLSEVCELPPCNVEPSDILVVEVAGSETRAVAAPRGVAASHVAIHTVPSAARPGQDLEVKVSLTEAYPSRLPEELDIAKASVSRLLKVVASIDGAPKDKRLKYAVIPASPAHGFVVASLAVPESCRIGSEVIIHAVTLLGRPIIAEPLHIRVTKGMNPPLKLDKAASDYSASPAISGSGILYAPDSHNPTSILVFGPDGSSHTPLLLSALRLSESRTAAWADQGGANGILYVADRQILVAYDIESQAVRWSTLPDRAFRDNMGIVPLRDVVMATSYSTSTLHVYRAVDGVRIQSLPCISPSHAAVDPTTGAIFVSSSTIEEFAWDGTSLAAVGPVDSAAPSGSSYRCVAVIPGRRGSSSVLVCACWGRSELHVVSLPERQLVRKHTLTGMAVSSLAADPSGLALAIGDSRTSAIHVLPWPLPDLPLAALSPAH